MAMQSGSLSLRVRLGIFVLTCACGTSMGEEFHWIANRQRGERVDRSWANPAGWAEPGAPPRSASDVGIILRGAEAHVGPDLGKPGDRPTIEVREGGMLEVVADTQTPIRLAGGNL